MRLKIGGYIMITLQHSALYLMALAAKRKANYLSEFMEEVPYVLFPDAIRAYIGPRQAGHFEMAPSGMECSWMKYPCEQTIRSLTRDNAAGMIQHYVVPNQPKCVIGERTNLNEFDVMNWGHKHYHSLRIHMLQDCVMDSVLRDKMVYVTRRFEDKFVVRHNGAIIDGATLRQQITLFETLGFLRLVGKIYCSTGTILNQGWFERNVLSALMDLYPEELAANTYKFMKISEDMNSRISNRKFDLTEEEKASIIVTDKPERLMDEMYSEAYLKTYYEL